MFRRSSKNKARGGGGDADAEDMVRLTGPDVMNSSSSPLPQKGKGRFSRKKKAASKQQRKSSSNNGGAPTSSNGMQSKSSPVEEMIISVPETAASLAAATKDIKTPTTESNQAPMNDNSSSHNNKQQPNISNVHQTYGMMTATSDTRTPQSGIFRAVEYTQGGGGSSNRSIALTMSESSASSAMGSDVYINSLENIPTTSSDSLLKSVKDFPVLNVQFDKNVKGALSREVGRNGLPATSLLEWHVLVGDPKWDDREGRYKYKVELRKNEDASGNFDSYISKSSSFNGVSARRSLQDFIWLEKALRAEFHGALIAPLLCLTIYFATMADGSSEEESLDPLFVSWDATDATTQSIKFLGQILDNGETVDKDVLSRWLSDVINGVRGNGEVSLRYGADILQSEAFETFLFRHTEALNGTSASQMGASPNRASSLGSPFDLFSIFGGNVGEGCYNNSMLSLGDVIKTPFAFFDNACGGDNRRNSPSRGRRNIYSSGATGVAGMSRGAILSEADFDDAWLLASTPNSASRSELLEAERDYIASSIKSLTDGIAKVQALAKSEDYVGQCWQNLANAMSDLYSVEKDLETAHIGDQIKSNKKKQPFRKLKKNVVNEVLLGLSQGKIDRAQPSLLLLGSMLTTYYTDLNSVVPSFKEYSDAIRQLDEVGEAQSVKEKERRNASAIDQLRSFITDKCQTNETTTHYSMEDEVTLGSLNTTQSKALQNRVSSNERMLKRSVTSLCKSSSLRNARIAWWYFKTEAKQAANVHAAAVALRQALSIDAEAAAAMKERRYDEDETKDNASEIDLVKRILDLGKNNFTLSNNESIESSPYSESIQDVMNMAVDQVGRWNANTAQSILEAAGVVDAEVTIDETSRELRHVRKYAISLRENVERCLEAVTALASVWDSGSEMRISKSRREFWAAMSTLFSGKIMSKDSHNVQVLASVGIDTQDRGGWLGVKSDNESSVSC